MKSGILIVFVLFFSAFLCAQTNNDKAMQEVFKLIGERPFVSIEKEAFDNQVGKTNLKFRLELLRVKGKDEIITQKYEYPLPVIDLSRVPILEKQNMNFTIYGDLFAVPITTLNLDKAFLAKLKGDQYESTYYYGLLVIPIKKVGDEYFFKLFVMTNIQILGTDAYCESRGKEVSLKVGDKIRLDLEKEKGNWSIKPIVNGKAITFTSDNSFFKNVNEFLILSLESDK